MAEVTKSGRGIVGSGATGDTEVEVGQGVLRAPEKEIMHCGQEERWPSLASGGFAKESKQVLVVGDIKRQLLVER